MKRFLILLVIISMFSTASAFADILNLTTLPANTAGGYYVGAVGGNVNDGAPMSFFCDDFSTTTYVPSSFGVNISTIPSLGSAKWGNDAAALFKYEEAAWLISQMALNPDDVGPIQYAIWNIFYPAANDLSGQEIWIARAQGIDPASYDFSSVRIYTASNTLNQEFMSGGDAPVPEPATVFLVGSGLLGVAWFGRKFKKQCSV